jgi:hypothetical protein
MIVGWLMMELPRVAAAASWTGVNGSNLVWQVQILTVVATQPRPRRRRRQSTATSSRACHRLQPAAATAPEDFHVADRDAEVVTEDPEQHARRCRNGWTEAVRA